MTIRFAAFTAAALCAAPALAQIKPAVTFDVGGKFDKSFNEASYNGAEAFKKKTGMTPYAWLKRLRLERGKLLLARGLPVSEVALAVGFFDQSHFHHGFRQAFGLTPADYRQQMLPS